MAQLRFIALEDCVQARCIELEERLVGKPTPRCQCCVIVSSVLDETCAARMAAREQSPQGQGPEHLLLVALLPPETAVIQKLLAGGVEDVLTWGCTTADEIYARLARWDTIDEALCRPAVQDCLIGQSRPWRDCMREVAECALFSNAPLIITGPTGTGKELLARLLHTLDRRTQKGNLVVVDCTTLSKDLAGSELFGHERGAFTGAVSEREGAVSQADQGTLYLDEVGELPLELQAQLLRVLQEQAFRRVGGTRWLRADFRVVCATNRDLPTEVAEGRFRADLYHRLAAVTCRTPALHERRQDIAALVHHAIEGASAKQSIELAPELLQYLEQRTYDGNVRELVQLIRACCLHHCGIGPLTLGCLPLEERGKWCGADFDRSSQDATFGDQTIEEFVDRALQASVGLKDLGRRVEATAVRLAMEQAGSITAAAIRLGVTPRALHLRRAAERDEVLAVPARVISTNGPTQV
jgi:transcriptional regulator with GAF, ATPase, and Fis domain